jgi:Ammonium Transporter Family
VADFPTMGVPDTGDTAWMLAGSALVILMTPGPAFFYGGMVRAKSVLNMLMMSFTCARHRKTKKSALTRPNTLKPLTISLVSDRALH